MEKMIAWLEAHARWGQLRALGNSNLVRASVLMPVFGYMLLLNDNVHQYLTIKYDGRLLNYLPAIWRIWLLFYGSFFVAIGSILYSFFCPPEVKRYQSAFEMADAESQHQLNLGQFDQVRDHVKARYARLSKWERSILPFHEPRYDLQSYGDKQFLDRVSTYLVHQWTLVNVSMPSLRVSILTLFTVGLFLLAVPAAFTFLQVTILAVKRMFS